MVLITYSEIIEDVDGAIDNCGPREFIYYKLIPEVHSG